MSVTQELSAAVLELPHPIQVEQMLPATPQAPRMTLTWQTPDVVTVVCQHPAQRKQRRWKWRTRQKRNDKNSQEKFYTCQHQSISQHDVKITSSKNYGWGLWGALLPPPPLATPLWTTDAGMVVLQIWQWKFSHKETLYQTLFDWIWLLFQKIAFEPSFLDLGVTYALYI